jgi:hypothetical protein
LTRAVAGARIWYQSLTDPDADRPYFTRLSEYLRSVSSPGYEVEVFGIQPGARHPHPITEFRCAAQVIANALTAQQQPPHRLCPAAQRGSDRVRPRLHSWTGHAGG